MRLTYVNGFGAVRIVFSEAERVTAVSQGFALVGSASSDPSDRFVRVNELDQASVGAGITIEIDNGVPTLVTGV